MNKKYYIKEIFNFLASDFIIAENEVKKNDFLNWHGVKEKKFLEKMQDNNFVGAKLNNKKYKFIAGGKK